MRFLEIASPMPLLRVGSHRVSCSRPFPVEFWLYPRMERSQPLWATCFNVQSLQQLKKKVFINLSRIFCIQFLPNSSLVGNHAVPLLQVTHGSPLYLNHVDLSSSQLSFAVLFSCPDWSLLIGVTENSSLGECFKTVK